jgi:hypothetical protein
LLTGNALDNARHRLDRGEVHGAAIARDPDGRARGAGDRMRFEPQRLNAVADGANLLVGGVTLHHDKHVFSATSGETRSLLYARRKLQIARHPKAWVTRH